MTPAERSQAVRALREAAALLMASELAYPKDMRDAIMRNVREAYLRWLVFQFQAEVRKHKDKLKAEGKVPSFRLSKDLAFQLNNYFENGGGMYDLEKAVNRNEIPNEDAMRIDKFMETGKPSDLKGMNPQNLHFVISMLETLKDDSGIDMKTRKEAYRLMQKLAGFTGGGLSEKSKEYHEDMLKQATSILGDLKKHVAGKVTGPAAKLATVKWKQNVDLSDLPQQYRRLEPTLKWIEVLVRVDKRIKKWAGSYSHGRTQLTIYIPTQLPGLGPMRTVNKNLAKIEETVEHELRHMVQSMLQDTYGQKAGTRFGPGEELPGWDPKLKMKHVAREAYPHASEKERYYLGPDEFYPNLETAVFRFKQRFDGVAREPTRWQFKVYVGLRPGRPSDVVGPSPFFMAYKKHDQARYRKAVSEAWTRLKDFVTRHSAIPVTQLLKAPEGAVVQSPRGTIWFTKRGDQWVSDTANRVYDSKEFAQAMKGGEWVFKR